MKSLFTLLCIALTVYTISSSCADTGKDRYYDSNYYLPTQKSHFPLDFSWLIERYDFDRVEEYIGEYYATYYKNWERYLTTKQSELAGRFGLTSIIFMPNFRSYENTKIALSKSVWNNRLTFRYIAPVGDISDFELSIALRPHRFVTLFGKSQVMERGGSIAIVVNKPLGRTSQNGHLDRNMKRLIVKAKHFAKR